MLFFLVVMVAALVYIVDYCPNAVGNVKVRKLLGWDKDSLIEKAKTVHANKTYALHIMCISLAYINYKGGRAITICV